MAARFRRWRLSVEGFDLPGVARRRGRRHHAPNRGDLDIASLNEPAGTYTLYVLVQDPENWKLIINNQTGQNEDSYDPSVDLGRVDMEMEKPPVPVENLKYTITTKGDTGKLQLEWENHIASVSFRAN